VSRDLHASRIPSVGDMSPSRGFDVFRHPAFDFRVSDFRFALVAKPDRGISAVVPMMIA
jgi:hypothetical protein